VYRDAMGITFAQFKTHLRRAYERSYSGELAWLRAPRPIGSRPDRAMRRSVVPVMR
jgi:hypothetical protein